VDIPAVAVADIPVAAAVVPALPVAVAAVAVPALPAVADNPKIRMQL
jgi:hypothetical protein